MCAILSGESLQAQALKSRLESHYGTRIDPQSFYGALDALEQHGFVETEIDGIHDVFRLTERGEAHLHAHLDWLCEQTASEHDREMP